MMIDSRDILQSRRWGLLVGVNEYTDSHIPRLRFSVHDASALYELFVSRPEYYDRDRLRLLVSDGLGHSDATRQNILANLMEIADAAGDKDQVLFYFSGHGQVVDGEAYLLPTDVVKSRLLPDTAIGLRRVKDILLRSSARSKIIVLDACHLGVGLGSRSAEQEYQAFIESVREEAEGIAILAASAQDELSWEDPEKEHGVFTYYLIEGLAGAANTQYDRYITVNEVAQYIAEKVKEWGVSRKISQRPTLEFQGTGEFVLLTALDSVEVHAAVGSGSSDPRHEHLIVESAVKQQSDFYNRNRELNIIKGILNAMTHKAILIQGGRYSGKTSLLLRVAGLLSETQWPNRHYIYCMIEPNSFASCAELAMEIWDGLKNSLRSHGTMLIDESPFNFDTFSRYIAQLSATFARLPGLTFVIFIDELDKVFYQCSDLERNRILGLIRHITETTDVPIIFCISIVQDLPPTYGSIFSAEKIQLGPFEHPAFTELAYGLLRGHADLSDEVAEWLYTYTGGYPFALKLLLAKLFELYVAEDTLLTINLEMLWASAQIARRSPRADDVFGDIYSTYLNDDERHVVLWLATAAAGVLAAEEIAGAGAQRSGASKQLRKRGYLIQQEDGGCRLRIGLMRDWLHDWPNFEPEIERLRVPIPTSADSPGAAPPATAPVIIPAEGLCIDQSTQRVYLDGAEIVPSLSDLEYRALVYLAERSGQLVAKEAFALHIWQEKYYIQDDQRIYALTYRLRDALNDKRKPYRFLETLRGRGFRLQGATFVQTRPPIDTKG